MNKIYTVTFPGGIIGLFQGKKSILSREIAKANKDGYVVTNVLDLSASSPIVFIIKLFLSLMTLFIWGPGDERILICRSKELFSDSGKELQV